MRLPNGQGLLHGSNKLLANKKLNAIPGPSFANRTGSRAGPLPDPLRIGTRRHFFGWELSLFAWRQSSGHESRTATEGSFESPTSKLKN